MKKYILFLFLILTLGLNAQEGTKQLMPNSTDILWLEFNTFTGKEFGTYDATDKERIYIYLNEDDKMHFGLMMHTASNYGGNVLQDPNYVSFRVMDPDGIEVVGFSEQTIVQSGEAGFIDSHHEAITGPNGLVINDSTISTGYDALSFTAQKTGNYRIEFQTWRWDFDLYGGISGGNEHRDRRFALEFFDVTVTDGSNNLITNSGDPNTSAGRLWSKGWGLTNTSFTENPVKTEFFVFTADEFVNKVQYEMKPFSFSFVANSYGVQDLTSLNYIEKAESQDGDYTSSSDISEYRIFLNDPDRGVWTNTTLPPPEIKVWAEGTLIYDYSYTRNPQLLDIDIDTLDIVKNEPDCPYSDITLFKIETSVDGFAAILLDIDGGGYSVDGGKDRVLYQDLKKGLNFVLWNFRDDNGDTIPNGNITASATFLGRGPANFPLYDVESLSGISTSSIRPFNKLGPTLYWDDTQISDWGDSGGAMTETSQSQLTIDNHIPRVWVFDSSKETDQHNGNLATLNSWFNAIDLGLSDINLKVSQSLTKCVNGYAPYVGDIYMEGPINGVITFAEDNFIVKYFDPNDNDLDSIAVLSLPTNGILELNGVPVAENDSIANYDLADLTFTPDTDWNGITSFNWAATNGLFWSLNQDTVFLIVNTAPTISAIEDTSICTNSVLANLPFTIDDLDVDETELDVIAYSHDPTVVPNSNITVGGVGANRTVTVLPKSNTSGFSIIYVLVDDGLSQAIEEFTVYIGPSIDFTGDTTVCDGNPLELSADEFGATYTWEFDGSVIRTTKDLDIDPFTTDSVGVYTLTVEKDGCSATRDINVAIAPLTTFIGDTQVCIGEDISLSADETVATLYSWKKGGAEIGTSKVLEIADADLTDIATNYTLEVTKEGCNNTSPEFAISVIAAPLTDRTLINDTVTSGNDATITVENAENGITYNAYVGTTLVGTNNGTGVDLDITVDGDELSVGNNIITVTAQNVNCELENSTNTNVFVREPGITVSVISGNTHEDGTTATFTIVLDAGPIADVTIGLSSNDIGEGTVSPASLVFTQADWFTVQTVTLTGVDDDIDDGNQSYTIITADASSTDSNYSGMLVDDVSVINEDDGDNAGITVSALSNNTEEDGTSGTFTIVLDSEPVANVTIGLSSDDIGEGTVSPAGVTFTSGNWNIQQTITVTGVNDDLNDGDQPYNIVTADATSTDGNYSGMVVADVAVTNIDDDAAGFNITAISGNTTEAGGTATFTIALTCEPTDDVVVNLSSDDTGEGTVLPTSVTFTAGTWSVAQTIIVTGVDDDVVDGDQAYNIITSDAVSLDADYGGMIVADMPVTNNDDDVAGITVSAISGNTSETGTTATFTIVLDSEPIANVTIGLSSNDTGEGTVSPASVTFTSGDWDTPQTITVTGVDDDIQDGNQPYSIVTATATSTDGNYSVINPNDVAVINNDDGDAAGITVSAISGNTSETGTTATFTIVLDSEPTANVTIDLSSDDTGEGTVFPASVTFTSGDWDTPQTVTVTGVDDDIQDGNQTFSIVTAAATSADGNYTGMNASDVSVTNNDDGDTAGITVSTISGNTSESGTTASFTIVLDSEPTANVTIGLSSDDTSEGTVSPASVTFTSGNWDTPQIITVTGVNDALADGDQTYHIVTSAATSTDGNYTGMNPDDVTVINIDGDVASINVSVISGHTAEDGTTATFTIVLTSQPTADVTIDLSSDDPSEGTVLSTSVTFTSGNWDSARTITVTGVDDDIDDGNVTYNIVTAPAISGDGDYSAMNAADVSVINDDDSDAAGITVSAISGNTTEAGGTATFTIVLDSEPTDDVTINLSSDDLGEGTVLPASVTFTSGNWNSARTITVTGVNDDIDDGNITYHIITSLPTTGDGLYAAIDPDDVTVINTDDDTFGITVSAISGNTTEAGGTATFTIVLDSEPTDDVTINLSSDDTGEGTVLPTSVTFTSGNWNSAQTVTVTGVNDDIDDGNQPYNIVTAAASSGDGNYNLLNASDVAVINEDDDNAGITVSVISGNTTEAGGTATFTIVLDSEPTADVVIALSSDDTGEGTISDASITFTSANWNIARTITVTGVHDDIDDGNQTYNIVTAAATSGDPNYNTTNPTDVVVINEDDDTAGISVSAISNNTGEDGTTATFTIVLDSEPTANVTIGLSSDDTGEGTIPVGNVTFSNANWNVVQTITVTGIDDDIQDGNQTYNIVTAAATSGDLNYNTTNPTDVVVINNDDGDTAGITVSLISGNTTEAGGTATFTIVLDSEPTANVTIGLSSDDPGEGTVLPISLTFLPGNWDTPQIVTVTGVNDDIDDSDQTYHIVTAAAASGDSNYNGTDPSDVTVMNIDDDNAGISVSLISNHVTEAGATATFTIVLDSEPTADVTINLNSGDLTEGTISDASITFTSGDWDTPQTITVTGVDDDIDDGNQFFDIETSSASSADLIYNGRTVADVPVINDDDDIAGITVSAISGDTDESGTTATFTVVLDSEPIADVTISLISDDLSEGTISDAILTFTSGNWDTPQTVTVTGVNDDIDDDDQIYDVLTGDAASADAKYLNMTVADVSVTNIDDDAVGVSVTAISGDTDESGATATFTIVLDSEPTADVSIDLTSDDLTEGTVSPASVIFTSGDWDTPQTVTVTGVDDNVDDGDILYHIVTANAVSTDPKYTGMIVDDVNVINIDNDAVGFTITETGGSTVTSENGSTDIFTVVLNSEPLSDIVFDVLVGDPSEGYVDKATLTFIPSEWNIAQTVTVTGEDDVIVDGTVAYSIIVSVDDPLSEDSYDVLADQTISVNNTDNDAAGVTISSVSNNTEEDGTTATFTMVLNTQPTADVNINLSSSDPIEGTVAPTSVVFTNSDWNTPQTITITGVDDDIDDGNQTYNIITAAATSADGDYNGLNPDDISVINVDNDTAGITVSTISGNTSETGTTATFTIVLDSEPTADVIIGVSSDDPIEGSILPVSVTFTSGDWDTPQTLTVTGENDDIDDGDQTFNILTASAVSGDGNYDGFDADDVSVINEDDDIAGIIVSTISNNTSELSTTATFTIVLETEPTADVVIDLNSDDLTEGTVAPSSITFTSGDWSSDQTITVTGVDDNIDDGDQPYNIITTMQVGGDLIYNAIDPDDVAVINMNDGVPVAVNDTVTMNEDISQNIDILANDSGLDDGSIAITILTDPENGNVIVNGDNTITYVPNLNFYGEDSLEYQICDPDPECSTAKVLITVNPVNDNIPVAIDDSRGTSINTSVDVNVLFNDYNLEDGIKSVAVISGPSDGSIVVNGDNTIAYTPDTDYEGFDSFDYEVCDIDDECASATVTINVKVNNIEPVAANDNVTTFINTPIDFNVLSNDSGLEDGLKAVTINTNSVNGLAIVNPDNTLNYTPDVDFIGADSLVYMIEDEDGDYSLAKVFITVSTVPNSVPFANNDNRATSINTDRIVDVLTNDIGLGDGVKSLTVTSGPSNGTIVVNGNNTITYSPGLDYIGFDSFNYEVCDNDDECSSATVTIEVKETNYIPNAVNDNAIALMNSYVDINVLSNDLDLNDGVARVTIYSGASNGDVVVNPDNTITYTPYLWYTGTDNFEYMVADLDGDNDIASVNITINAVPNYIPVANDDNRATVINRTVDVNVLINDTGLEDGIKSLAVTSGPTNGSILVNPDNTITYTPGLDYLGFDTFDYEVCDNDDECAIATVTINVKTTNNVPDAINDNAVTVMNASVDINVLSNDTGLDDGLQDVTIYIDPLQGGNAVVNPDNTITYTPLSWYVGPDSFIYMVRDLDGDIDTATVNITVEVIPNYVPIANNDFRGTSLNTAVTVDVLSNDTGLEDGVKSLTIESNPSDGNVVVNVDNTITYTPDNGYIGSDIFEYEVCDNDDECAIARVNINVREVNHEPVANDDMVYTGLDTEVTIDVLGNDTGLEDGGILVTIDNDATNGAVLVNADQTVTYTPESWFEGTDNYSYQVVDADGDFDIANVTVIVMSGPLPGILVTTVSGDTKEDGTTAQFTVVLETAPTGDVSIALDSDDKSEGTVSISTLTFTSLNWDAVQTVTITGVNDDVDDGSIDYRVVTQNIVSSDPYYNGLSVGNIDVTNIDDDEAGITVSIDTLTTSEDLLGTNISFVLTSEPLDNVSIEINSSDLTEGEIVNEEMVFTPENWNEIHKAKIVGVDDDLVDGDITFIVSILPSVSNDPNYDQIDLDDISIINIDNDSKELIIPEAFSPGNDGFNDFFEVVNLQHYENASIRVYNRWGSLVYENENYQNDWDGKSNVGSAKGSDLPTGTYYFVMNITGVSKEISGSVFIKR
jgi:gliding motility-associated-like protein